MRWPGLVWPSKPLLTRFPSPCFPQILSHRKPPSGLVTPAPVPTTLGLPPGPSYLLPGSLPLGGCGSTPPTPTGLAAASERREGSSSSEGRGDTDKVSQVGVGFCEVHRARSCVV